SAASCSHPAVAWLPAPGSHPCHRTLPSRRRACAWTRPPLVPRLPLSAPPPLASMPRSSDLPCVCSSTYPLPLSFAQIILSLVRKQGSRSGETAISVRIVPEAELKHQSGGIQLVSTLASILSATFEHHIVEKSQAAQRENRVPFLIVYVKLPGHGSSDIKTTATFRDALCNVAQRASSLEHEVAALWLGSIYYHPVGEEMHFYCCLRSDAEWPAGLTPEDLTKHLKGRLSPI